MPLVDPVTIAVFPFGISILVGAERSGGHSPPFFRRKAAQGKLHAARFLFHADPAQFPYQFRPVVRRLMYGSTMRSCLFHGLTPIRSLTVFFCIDGWTLFGFHAVP
jgi:hypothetical protein